MSRTTLTSFANTRAAFRYRETLEGSQYLFAWRYSPRTASWYLSVYSPDGETLLAGGVRVVVNWPLLRRHQSPDLPPGEFLAVDMSGENRDIEQQADLGSRVRVVYLSSDDEFVQAINNPTSTSLTITVL